MTRYDSLSGSHDLSLPEWGPYSKKLFGISHLADRALGTRFDCSVIPGKYRRELAIPDVLRPSGYLPWNVAPDLSAYSYRQQLEWKDRIYCDVSFSTVNEKARPVNWSTIRRSGRILRFIFSAVWSLRRRAIRRFRGSWSGRVRRCRMAGDSFLTRFIRESSGIRMP